mmetsp:Transcript_19719/g.45932  ORF Transcript_19719/g.45932 Transcript_19719/m.45932 type:complete len:136 (-) Transcript_19719:1520-1927(-)
MAHFHPSRHSMSGRSCQLCAAGCLRVLELGAAELGGECHGGVETPEPDVEERKSLVRKLIVAEDLWEVLAGISDVSSMNYCQNENCYSKMNLPCAVPTAGVHGYRHPPLAEAGELPRKHLLIHCRTRPDRHMSRS